MDDNSSYFIERYRQKLKWIEFLINQCTCADPECVDLINDIRKAIEGEKPPDYVDTKKLPR